MRVIGWVDPKKVKKVPDKKSEKEPEKSASK